MAAPDSTSIELSISRGRATVPLLILFTSLSLKLQAGEISNSLRSGQGRLRFARSSQASL